PRASGAATMLASAAATDTMANAVRAMRTRRIRRAVMPASPRERQLRPFLRALDRRAVVRPDQPPVHLGAQLLGDHVGVDRVADDLRADEDDQLGAADRLILVGEEVAYRRQLVEQRNAGPGDVLSVADEPGEQHRLSALHRDRALDPALGHGRRERALAGRQDIAD